MDIDTDNKITTGEHSDADVTSLHRVGTIVSEFVEGFERLDSIKPSITIFGSARTPVQDRYYKMAEEIAHKLVDAGYGVITGGGPGIMEAGNKGAFENDGSSIGLNINLPWEQNVNKFVDKKNSIDFEHFFVRKVMLVKYAQGFVVIGTLDERCEIITLIQTKKSRRLPLVLVGREYWDGLYQWVRRVMLDTHNMINTEDIDLLHIVDTSDEAVACILDFYSDKKHDINF